MTQEAPPYLDPQDFYAQEMDSWESLWDYNLNVHANVANILGQAVFLPQKDLMLPIVATYMLIPSKWAKILPILFSWGGKGSGKSTTAILAAKLHGQKQVFSPTDTFASLRNALNSLRWIDPQERTAEKEGAILCWDNIHSGTLDKDERIYQMLLFGYNRTSDVMAIANNNGTNLEFNCFCPKIISSIDDIHLIPSYEELHRRLLVIPHKSWNDFTPEEKQAYDGFDINNKLDIDSIYWDGIEDKFYNFWNNADNCKQYAKYRSLLTRKNSSVKHSIRSEQWIISVDIIVTGLITGCWNSTTEAVEHMTAYWNYANLRIFGVANVTQQLIEAFINEEIGMQKTLNKQLVESGREPIKLVIQPQKLKSRIAYHQTRGELDINPNTKDILEIMSRLGWRLSNKGWVEKR